MGHKMFGQYTCNNSSESIQYCCNYKMYIVDKEETCLGYAGKFLAEVEPEGWQRELQLLSGNLRSPVLEKFTIHRGIKWKREKSTFPKCAFVFCK